MSILTFVDAGFFVAEKFFKRETQSEDGQK